MKKVEIAVIEDNQDLNFMLVEDITAANYKVTGYLSVESFEDSSFQADIIILDINLPVEDGFMFASRYRKKNQQTFLVALSARSGRENKIAGYRSGIDIYLEKPISSVELLSILNRISERLINQVDKDPVILQRPLFRLDGLTLSGSHNTIVLKPRECRLLVALSQSKDHKLSYNDCILALGDDNMKRANLEVFVGRLRKKLEAVSGIYGSIQSIRGWGYIMAAEIGLDAKR